MKIHSSTHKNPVWRDASTILLIVSNLVTIALAIHQQWEIATILLIYWGQAASIGFFNVLRINAMRSPSFEMISINGKPANSLPFAKHILISFFVGHFGLFMLMYFAFLFIFFDANLLNALPGMLIFFVNHGFSYWFNKERDAADVINGTRLFLFPYLRIMPMHTIVSGSALFAHLGIVSVILFLLLKTVADVIMHIVEHTYLKPTFDKP
jgi:hypothetical protein